MAPKDLFSPMRAKTSKQVPKLYADLTARGPVASTHGSIFLACLSSRSAGRVGYVQNEFRLALAAFGERPPASIYLIPVRLDDCEVPDLQIPDRGLSLRDIQGGGGSIGTGQMRLEHLILDSLPPHEGHSCFLVRKE